MLLYQPKLPISYRLVKWLSIASCILLVSACTTLSPPTQSPRSFAEHRAQLQQLTNWQATGVVGVRSADQANTVYVTWRQYANQMQITFFSSLGTSIARLQGTPGHITLITQDDQRYHAADPDQLTTKLLGWPLPVSGLYYWIRGLPMPGTSQQLSTPLLSQLQQQGWNIDYQRYQTVAGYTLPYQLTLKRKGLQLRIIVKKWSILRDNTI